MIYMGIYILYMCKEIVKLYFGKQTMDVDSFSREEASL